jgi:hypothetical protein
MAAQLTITEIRQSNPTRMAPWVPTPEEIAAECAAIQSEWDESTRRSRETGACGDWVPQRVGTGSMPERVRKSLRES